LFENISKLESDFLMIIGTLMFIYKA